jgi:hypothetical protein
MSGEDWKGNKGLERNVCVSFYLFLLTCFLSMRFLLLLLLLRMAEVVGVGVGRRGDKLVLL